MFKSLCRSLLFSVFCISGCSAQSATPAANSAEVSRRIENGIRNEFQLPPSVEVTIGARKASEMPGYDQIAVTLHNSQRTQTFDFLISKDNKTLARLDKMDIGNDLDVAGRPVHGNKDAKVTIVSFDDLQCPFCSRMHHTLMEEVPKAYGDTVRVIYKDYPLVEIHPWSMHAAVDANCLAAQNGDAYWQFADKVHYGQKELNEKHETGAQMASLDQLAQDVAKADKLDAGKVAACARTQDESMVKKSVAEGKALNIDSTPTIFVNGERVSGAIPMEALTIVIDRALRAEGVTPPKHETASPSDAATPASSKQP